jgi:hypothetical protein
VEQGEFMKNNKNKITFVALIALVLVFAACSNPAGSGGAKNIDPDTEDFGPSPVIETFDVTKTEEWEEARTAIKTGGDNKNYVINVTGNVPIKGVNYPEGTFSDTDASAPQGITVSLRGGGTLVLDNNSPGDVIKVVIDQTLILRDITLKGMPSNSGHVLNIYSASKVKMYDPARIIGNSINGQGGGVFVSGSFTMYGGEISGNTALGGGGVYISFGSFSTMIMYGGKISGNFSDTLDGNYAPDSTINGAGVFASGSFTKIGGIISDNEAHNDGDAVYYSVSSEIPIEAYYCDAYLDGNAHISTTDALPSSGTVGRWTRQ